MAFMELRQGFLVSPQISVADVAAAKAAGATLIVCNRPDGEAPGQPSAAEIGEAAQAEGLAFAAIPISAGITGNQINELDKLMSEHSSILAYCGSGRRSSLLWSATRARAGDDVEELIAAAANVGLDLSEFRAALTGLAQGA